MVYGPGSYAKPGRPKKNPTKAEVAYAKKKKKKKKSSNN
jgi:hypothetical protein